MQQIEIDVDAMEKDFMRSLDFWKSIYLRKDGQGERDSNDESFKKQWKGARDNRDEPERRGGEFFGFIRLNGAGKPTPIRTLLGFITPTGGEARVLGMDIRREKERISE